MVGLLIFMTMARTFEFAMILIITFCKRFVAVKQCNQTKDYYLQVVIIVQSALLLLLLLLYIIIIIIIIIYYYLSVGRGF